MSGPNDDAVCSLVDIVVGSAADIASIMPVMVDAFDPQFGEAWNASQCAGMLSLPNTQLYIARSSTGTVLGFAMSRNVADEAELLLLAVSPKARRKGVGGTLLKRFVVDATESKACRLFLEVRSGNSAINFYEHVGFLQVGRRLRYYRGLDGNVYDALTYQYRG
jgi:[ribosomal protein S18]-alanine N-acetyltransferase